MRQEGRMKGFIIIAAFLAITNIGNAKEKTTQTVDSGDGEVVYWFIDS